LLLAVALLLPALAPSRARAKSAPTVAIADSLYQAQRWAEAARAYQALATATPGDARLWTRLGGARHQLKQYRPAADAYARAVAIAPSPNLMYNLACVHAMAGEKDRAFEWLDKAAAAGFSNEDLYRTDPELAALRGDPRDASVAARLHANAAPCEGDPEHHRFDFWIGEWDVKTPQGQLAGRSRIERILGQCVILENWTGTQGGSGKSFNAYDKIAHAWKQFWVDDRGTVTTFVDGAFRDGAMWFATTHPPGVDGRPVLGRLSFHDLGPNRVRQWKERSVDGGATWTTDYDFTYERTK
jgi:tetratricopeptide (TPR) repeat protein